MMALPHHVAVMNLSKPYITYYRTVKGRMVGVMGPTWRLKETYGNISWHPNRGVCFLFFHFTFSSSNFFYFFFFILFPLIFVHCLRLSYNRLDRSR